MILVRCHAIIKIRLNIKSNNLYLSLTELLTVNYYKKKLVYRLFFWSLRALLNYFLLNRYLLSNHIVTFVKTHPVES